jgi:flagellar biosynthesis protein FlhF
MKIKKFVGKSFKDALEIVKKELGPDAIILSSKAVKAGPFGIGAKEAVEVTAAIDETVNMPSPESISAGGGATASIGFDGMEELLREIRGLRDEVGFLKETLRPIVPTLRVGKDKKGLFNLLINQGVDTQFAIILLERAQNSLDSLKNAIKRDVKIQGLMNAEESGLIFLGPPGVGKTTTMSKIAHLLVSKRKPVNLISLDDNRIGSLAYMKEMSRQLRCPLKVVRKISDLPKMIYKEAGRGPVLIDTPGYYYKEILEDINEIFPSGFPAKKCFLVDSTMSKPAAMKSWQSCNTDMIDSIGFTKLDMATQHGNIYNMSLLTSRPLSFITTGPDVPDDIRIPTSDFLAGLIIGGA